MGTQTTAENTGPKTEQKEFNTAGAHSLAFPMLKDPALISMMKESNRSLLVARGATLQQSKAKVGMELVMP